MESAFHDFRIETDETGVCKHIFIDGVEQMGVVACDIRLRVDEAPSIRMEYQFTNISAALSAGVIETTKTFTDGVLDQGLENLELSSRAYNSLRRGMWNTWADADHNRTIADVLIAYRTGHLKKYRGMGSRSYDEIISRLKEFELLETDE